MKRKLMLFAGAVAMLSLTSCKKDWVCDCTISAGGQTANISPEASGLTKKDAEEWCDAQVLNAFYNCNLKAK